MGMKEQIDLFNETVENYLPRQINNAEELSKYLSKSIFVISIGSNDYLYNYLQPQYYTTSRQYDMDEFGDLLMLELEKHLKVPYFVTFVALLLVKIKQLLITYLKIRRAMLQIQPSGAATGSIVIYIFIKSNTYRLLIIMM